MYQYGYQTLSQAAGTAIFATAILTIIGLIYLIISAVLLCIGLWKTFEKLGYKGWEGLIFLHNAVCLFEKADIPKKYVFLYYIPHIGWIGAGIYLGINLMKKFGKGPGMGVLLGILPQIGFMIIGFSKNYVYHDDKAELKAETTNTNINQPQN